MGYSSYARHAAARVGSTRSASASAEEERAPRAPITRVNRACNACRRAKIRCVGAEDPPCERCRVAGQTCVLERPARAGGDAVEERVSALEAAMGEVRALLGEVVRATCPQLARSRSRSPPRRGRTPRRSASPALGLGDVAAPLGGLSSAPARERELDPVSAGALSEAEGRALVRAFYAGPSGYINAYDPAVDGFDALRRRSAFSLTAVMLVGARARDGARVSAAQGACRAAAETMAAGTLLRGGDVEAVKALVLLAAFGDNGWLLAGHAVYRLEHQMSYGAGRAAVVREDEGILRARELLAHPLALESDTRLVYAVELLALRAPLHVELSAAPDAPLTPATLARLRWANDQFDAWERHWAEVLAADGRDVGFVRESLSVQRQLAELFINSQLLRGVHSPADVAAMDGEGRALALRAMHSAARCVDYALRGEFYAASLAHGTHYTHVCAAFAASFLARIARFFPREMDLAQVADDVEAVAGVLESVPAGRYARSLRLMLRKARREGILPASKRSPPPPDTPPPAVADWLGTLQAGLDPAALHSGGDAPLPLFLSGDLGTSAAPSDAVPFVGLEDFFLPPGLDDLLAGYDCD
ncbi:hypothetical protein Q8F55_007426 [Vanrija albida]|uniref:Zn(2)-C6 fungal-type domain-containing protein n=1 Tax=Vanrija albida TaxID=181172 RepID=A0ABR3PUH0_9TREE